MSLGALLFFLLRLLLYVLVLSCPEAEKRDPPYPPLADRPSLPTPCEDREVRQEGGGGGLFSALWDW